MPFFYSQYLRDERKKYNHGANPPPSRACHSERRLPSKPHGTPQKSISSRLVWHSNIGAASTAARGPTNFKPLKYNAEGKRKPLTVHFSTIEVQPFHFDWRLADDVFYTRKELTAMGQSRFDDAATLRRRHVEKVAARETVDDLDLGASRRAKKVTDIATLLTNALEDEDGDKNVSIRGIEHFVYPDLQQEMIRRKKEVQREVLEFVRAKRPDPQGWRLAQHSRTFSQWARNVAMEKGMKYCMNNAATDPDVELNDCDVQGFQRSIDEIEASSLSLRGSSSFSQSLASLSPSSFDMGNSRSRSLEGISEDGKTWDKAGGLDGRCESQPPGVHTGEE